ncbi:MAG: hypothetical protein AB8B56_15650 [Crocinitomicaceae bacterium]
MKELRKDRVEGIYIELLEKCTELDCFEFEYYWEMWGLMWYPWFVEIADKSVNLSFNDLTQSDLDQLVELNKAEVIKVYSQDEMTDEFDRRRYKLKTQ